MGRPRFPDKQSVETLKEAAHPNVITERTESVGGMYELNLTLTKNEITLIEIQGVNDETETYFGLDDTLITSYSN